MELHERIRTLREGKGLSQEALAHAVGYTDRSSVAKIEAGQVSLSADKIARFAQALGVSPGYLTGWNQGAPENVIPLPTHRKVPLIGTIACGKPILAVENLGESVDIPDFVHADFALRCRGDSMINARIFDGDVVYIRAQPEVENGQIAAVRIGEEATLKRVYYFPDHQRMTLRACNPIYEDLDFRDGELDQVEVLGLAVGFVSLVRHPQE